VTNTASGIITKNYHYPRTQAKPSRENQAPLWQTPAVKSQAKNKPQHLPAQREVASLELSVFGASAALLFAIFIGILGWTQHHVVTTARLADLDSIEDDMELTTMLLETGSRSAPSEDEVQALRQKGLILEVLPPNTAIPPANPRTSGDLQDVEGYAPIHDKGGKTVSVLRLTHPSLSARSAAHAVRIYLIGSIIACLGVLSFVWLALHLTSFRKLKSLSQSLHNLDPLAGSTRGGRDVLIELPSLVNRTLNRLHQELELHREQLDAHAEMFLQIGPDGTIVDTNAALCRLFGMAPENLAGVNYLDRVVPADRAELAVYLRHADLPANKHEFTHRILSHDGQTCWVRWRPCPRSTTGQNGLRFFGIDITAEQNLGASAGSMRAAFDQMQSLASTGSIIWHLSQNRMEWTQEALRLLSVGDRDRPPDLDALLSAVNEPEREGIRSVFEQARQKGDSFEAEFKVPLPDGQSRSLQARAEVTMDPHTKLSDRLTCTLRDITSLRQAEGSALRELDFRQAIERSLSVGLVVRDMQGNTISANPAFTKIVGYSEDELKANKPPLEPYWPEEEREKIDQALGLALRGQSPAHGFELRFCRKDGSRFDALVQVTTMLGEDGQMVAILGAVTDISEIQNSKRDLVAAEGKAQRELAYRRTIEKSVTVGLIAVDSAGHPLSVNPAFCQMLGMTEAEALSMRPPYPYWPQDKLAEIEQAFALHLEGKTPPDGFSLRFQKKDGTPLDVLLRAAPLYDANGKQLGVLSALTDVTALQQIGANLHLSNERLKLATDIAEVGLWDWEPESDALAWDKQTFAMYGYPDEVSPQAAWAKSVSPEEGERLTYELRRFIAKGGTSGQQSLMAAWPDGTTHHILSTYVVVRNSEGKCLRIFGVNRDITQELETERDLLNSKERLLATLEGGDFGIFEHVIGVGDINWSPSNYKINGIDPSITDPHELFIAWKEGTGDFFSELMCSLSELPVTQTTYTYEFIANPPGGEVRRIRTNIFIERDNHGHPVHLVGISRRLD